MAKNCEKQAVSCFNKLGRTKRVFKVGNLGANDEILTFQEKKSHIGNKTKISLEINPGQI